MAVGGSERIDRAGDVGDVAPDVELLRSQVREKYREVAVRPADRFHFHTGRPLAARLGYDADVWSTGCPIGRSSPSPASPTRSRYVSCSPVSASSMSAPEQGSTRSSPPTKWVRQVVSSAST